MVKHTEITFEEGWSNMQKGVSKLIRILEGEPEPEFSSQQYCELYTNVFSMCNQKKLDHSNQLYLKYREVIEDYIVEKVLPSLREKHDEYLIRELVKRWNNHKFMVKYLTSFFRYIDRFYVPRRRVPTLREVGLTCFDDLVYREMHSKVKEAVIKLIHKEREGEEIDRTLVNHTLFHKTFAEAYENLSRKGGIKKLE